MLRFDAHPEQPLQVHPHRGRARSVSRRKRNAWLMEALDRRVCLSVALANAVNYTVGSNPDFVASADFNGDGKRDLVVSSYNDSSLSILLGNGNGTFQTASTIALGAAPDFVTTGDVNGDGTVDLITASYDSNVVGVLLGNGNGTFQSAVSYAAGTGPRAVVLGDFTGDGKLDIAVAKSFDSTLTILKNNGNGTFQAPLNSSLSFVPNDLVTGDFNGDGKLDLASVDFSTDQVAMMLGNGNGTFQTAVKYTTGNGPTSIAAGDFDGDGKLDVVTANFLDGTVSILRGNGNGTLQSATSLTAGSGATFIGVSDVDADGNLDLVTANANDNSISVFFGNGDGTFSPATTYQTDESPRSLVVGNFDGTPGLDVAVANQGSNTIRVLLGGTPTQTAPVANAGGPYTVNEGGTVQLTGAASTGTLLTYAWDLDGDGVFGETGAGATRGSETGATPTFSAVGLDGPSTRTVSLRVTDSIGQTSTTTVTITINNVAPTLVISGNNTLAEGSTYTLNLSATDPGVDTISKWVITWGDGTIQTINSNPSSATHIFADNGSYTITATATDEDGTYNANSKSLTVTNVAPTLVISGGNSIAEGSTYTLNLSATDPGADTISAWVITWGDGTIQTINSNPSSATHIFADNGSYTISATATDEDGTYNANSKSVTVTNVAPTLVISGNSTVPEGSTYTLGLSATDPSADTISKWVITWGDGSIQTINSNPSSATHTFADNGAYTISATATDEDGTYSANSKALTVTNVPPTLVISGNNTLPEGSTYTLNLSATDPGADTINKWVITWGDGAIQTINSNPSSATHVFVDNGSYTISATATDEDGTYSANSKALTVTNVPPTLVISGNNTLAEGSTYTLNLSATDPGTDTISKWVITWGDGAIQTINSNPSSKTHVFADNGSYTITATATDEDGTYSSNSKALTVTNVPPTLVIGGNNTLAEGSTYTLNLSATDPGADTISQWVITWGDGTIQTINSNPSSATHLFADNGAFTITATATDEDGTYNANSKSLTVTNVPPTLVISGSSNVAVDTPYTLSLSKSDPGADTLANWTINWGDGTIDSVSGSATSADHTYTGQSAIYTISATAADEDGTYNANSFQLFAIGPAPLANPGGSYSVPEGGSITLDGSGSFGQSLTYAWDLDGDGSFGETGVNATRGDETGAIVTFSAAGLDGPGSQSVSLRVTDAFGATSIVSTDISITNVAPTLVIAGSNSIAAESAYALNLSATDPAPDTISKWVINWGDGTTQTITGHPSSATHTYTATGNFEIDASATDEDGTYDANSLAVTVSPPTDTTKPTASLQSAPAVLDDTGKAYTFSVNYSDNVALNTATLNSSDILVTGPNGFSQLATFVSAVNGTGAARIVTYSIKPSDGTWSVADNGAYTLKLQPSQVSDTAGNFATSATLGSFQAALIPPDLAGYSVDTARVLAKSTAGTVRVAEDGVGVIDRNDFYKVTLPAKASLAIKLSNLTDDADLQLLDSTGARLVLCKHTGTVDENINKTLNAGTYYVRVQYLYSLGTQYRLRVAATTPALVVSTPGDGTMQGARYLGSLTPGKVMNIDDFVGTDDPSDYYAVTINSPMSVYFKLSGLTENANVQVLNASGESLKTSNKKGTADEGIHLTLPAGTYFIHVYFAGVTGTNYRLRLAGA